MNFLVLLFNIKALNISVFVQSVFEPAYFEMFLAIFQIWQMEVMLPVYVFLKQLPSCTEKWLSSNHNHKACRFIKRTSLKVAMEKFVQVLQTSLRFSSKLIFSVSAKNLLPLESLLHCKPLYFIYRDLLFVRWEEGL